MKTVTMLLLALVTCGAASPEETAEARLPVRELSAFKDGTAVVVCEGTRPVDTAGNVVLDELPQPILGAFWPYSAEPGVALASATAARRPITKDRDAASVRDLLEANIGATVRITEDSGALYPAKILRLLGQVDNPGGLVLLANELGVKVLSIERIRDLSFESEPKTKLPEEQKINQLVLRPAWTGGKASAEAKVGVLYVQKGFRWIPEYRVDLGHDGKAHVRLQATLVNDLVTLEDTTVHLVVGVPSFAFGDKLDPMALQQAIAEVARSMPVQAQLSNDLRLPNMIMTQVAAPTPMEPATQGEPVSAPGDGNREELYTFTVPHVTLGKGERMTVPVVEFDLPCEDVYRLVVPLSAPPELRQALGQDGSSQWMKLPKVMHAVRLTNNASMPLTTSPALLVRDGKVLAQSAMTYTPSGARVDLDMTTAVDVQITSEDRETKRTPRALYRWWDYYQRIDLEGNIRLTSYRGEPVTVEVTRYLAGAVDSSGAGGKADQMNATAGPAWAPIDDWYRWPYWWQNLNGVGRIVWTTTLEPGKAVELPHNWHYFTH